MNQKRQCLWPKLDHGTKGWTRLQCLKVSKLWRRRKYGNIFYWTHGESKGQPWTSAKQSLASVNMETDTRTWPHVNFKDHASGTQLATMILHHEIDIFNIVSNWKKDDLPNQIFPFHQESNLLSFLVCFASCTKQALLSKMLNTQVHLFLDY